MRDRSSFTRRIGLALLLTAAVTIAGCGDDDNGGSSGSLTGPTGQAATGVIANNHNPGHSAVVSAEQIAAGRGLMLDIRGQADHSHMLDLTNDDMIRLQLRQRVERDASMQNSHTHRVTFN